MLGVGGGLLTNAANFTRCSWSHWWHHAAPVSQAWCKIVRYSLRSAVRSALSVGGTLHFWRMVETWSLYIFLCLPTDCWPSVSSSLNAIWGRWKGYILMRCPVKQFWELMMKLKRPKIVQYVILSFLESSRMRWKHLMWMNSGIWRMLWLEPVYFTTMSFSD